MIPIRKHKTDDWEYIKIKGNNKIIMKKIKGKLVKIGIEPLEPIRKFW